MERKTEMPFALVLIGLIMIVTGSRNTYQEFGSELVADLTGDRNFVQWAVAIFMIGSVGYYRPAQPLSRAFLVLVLIAMVLANGGVFDKLTESLREGTKEPTNTASGFNRTFDLARLARTGTDPNRQQTVSHFQTVVRAFRFFATGAR